MKFFAKGAKKVLNTGLITQTLLGDRSLKGFDVLGFLLAG